MWLEVWFRELWRCSQEISVLHREYGVTEAVYQWHCTPPCGCVLGGDPSLPGCIVSYGGHNGILWSPSRARHRLTKLGEVCAFCEGTYSGWHLVMSLSYVCNVQRVYEGFAWWPFYIYASYVHASHSFGLCYSNLLSHVMHRVRLNADGWNLIHPLMQHVTSWSVQTNYFIFF